ncbi:MAG TPA: hypothetical protein DCS82_11305 [Rhodospirillaceae bacterium]|nr:hypothetical protein [Rhodospirillaceae bacterium]
MVYQPGTERQAEQKHPEPPPLVDTDRPHSKSAKAGDGKRAADPLKVVMSPKTSGGRAVVAPQSEVPETQPSAAPVEPPVARAPITSPAQAKPPAKSVTPPPPVAAPTVPVVAAPPASNPEKLLDTPKAKADTVSAPLPPAPGGLATVAPPPPPVSAKKPTTQATPAVPLKPKSEADEAARLATTNTSENPVKSAFSGSVGYTVQLGAFSSEANANGLLKKLGGDIGNLRVEKGVTPSGRTLFYLRAGYFGKRSEASELAARLKADEKIKAGYVMRVKAPAATP